MMQQLSANQNTAPTLFKKKKSIEEAASKLFLKKQINPMSTMTENELMSKQQAASPKDSISSSSSSISSSSSSMGSANSNALAAAAAALTSLLSQQQQHHQHHQSASSSSLGASSSSSSAEAAMAALFAHQHKNLSQHQHQHQHQLTSNDLAKLNFDVKNFKIDAAHQQQLGAAYFSMMNGFGLEDLTHSSHAQSRGSKGGKKSLTAPVTVKSEQMDEHSGDDEDMDDEDDYDDEDDNDNENENENENSCSLNLSVNTKTQNSPSKSESPSCASSSGRHRATSRGTGSALVSSSAHSLDPHDDDHSSMTPSSSRSISPSSSSYRDKGTAGAANSAGGAFDSAGVLAGLNGGFSALPGDPLAAAAAIGVNPAQLPLTNNVATILATRKRRSERDSTGEKNKKIKPVPADKKDDAYWERRRKNNEAAKRSRDLRRQKEDEIAVRAAFLEQENLKLRAQVTILKAELSKLHFMIYNR